jgi:hypothetical protein
MVLKMEKENGMVDFQKNIGLNIIQKNQKELFKMNEIKTSGCINCPFRYTNYDDYAIGNDILEECLLRMYLNHKEGLYVDYFILSYDSKTGKIPKKILTPAWCPIKTNPIIKLNEN